MKFSKKKIIINLNYRIGIKTTNDVNVLLLLMVMMINTEIIINFQSFKHTHKHKQKKALMNKTFDIKF